jgi:hypothetical protein
MLDFLNTIPDMTNTPEITMQEPKTPMSKRIRAYKDANPDADSKQIAAALGSTSMYVYQILAKPLSKTKKAKPVAAKPPATTVPLKEHEAMVRRLAEQTAEVMDLEDEITGLRAVIKYLEERLDY